MTEETDLRGHLDALELPPDAVAYLCDIYNMIQVFDDVADGDAIKSQDLDRAIWSALAGVQMNPFYARNAAVLTPIVALQIMKWNASNEAERSGRADEQSYMHRAGFYDLVLMVAHLSGCMASHDTTLRLYGETYADYSKEFS